MATLAELVDRLVEVSHYIEHPLSMHPCMAFVGSTPVTNSLLGKYHTRCGGVTDLYRFKTCFLTLNAEELQVGKPFGKYVYCKGSTFLGGKATDFVEIFDVEIAARAKRSTTASE